MLYPELCAELFDGVVADGAYAQGPQSIAPSIEPAAREASMTLDPRIRALSAVEASPSAPTTPTSSGTSSPAPARLPTRKRGGQTGAELNDTMKGILEQMRTSNNKKTSVQMALESFFTTFEDVEGDWKNDGARLLTNEANASIWMAAAGAGDSKKRMEALIGRWMQEKDVN